ncbi:MAG TPA: hypothetical protein VD867_06450 [Burkholderiales bacterium]|nr:hypothetical protein [Burkholderiales bacterium]
MKTLFALLFVTLALGACKDQAETQQGVRDSANPDGQQLRKKYEEAGKQAEERRKAGE